MIIDLYWQQFLIGFLNNLFFSSVYSLKIPENDYINLNFCSNLTMYIAIFTLSYLFRHIKNVNLYILNNFSMMLLLICAFLFYNLSSLFKYNKELNYTIIYWLYIFWIFNRLLTAIISLIRDYIIYAYNKNFNEQKQINISAFKSIKAISTFISSIIFIFIVNKYNNFTKLISISYLSIISISLFVIVNYYRIKKNKITIYIIKNINNNQDQNSNILKNITNFLKIVLFVCLIQLTQIDSANIIYLKESISSVLIFKQIISSIIINIYSYKWKNSLKILYFIQFNSLIIFILFLNLNHITNKFALIFFGISFFVKNFIISIILNSVQNKNNTIFYQYYIADIISYIVTNKLYKYLLHYLGWSCINKIYAVTSLIIFIILYHYVENIFLYNKKQINNEIVKQF